MGRKKREDWLFTGGYSRMGTGAFCWWPKEVLSLRQAVPTKRGSDQGSSAREANNWGLSSPTGRHMLVRSRRLRQEKLGSGCLRIPEDVSRDSRACSSGAFKIGQWRPRLDILHE